METGWDSSALSIPEYSKQYGDLQKKTKFNQFDNLQIFLLKTFPPSKSVLYFPFSFWDRRPRKNHLPRSSPIFVTSFTVRHKVHQTMPRHQKLHQTRAEKPILWFSLSPASSTRSFFKWKISQKLWLIPSSKSGHDIVRPKHLHLSCYVP